MMSSHHHYCHKVQTSADLLGKQMNFLLWQRPKSLSVYMLMSVLLTGFSTLEQTGQTICPLKSFAYLRRQTLWCLSSGQGQKNLFYQQVEVPNCHDGFGLKKKLKGLPVDHQSRKNFARQNRSYVEKWRAGAGGSSDSVEEENNH